MSSCCDAPNSCCEKGRMKNHPSLSVALVGNPNCGKTTLFNALTGATQRVGNWPGVTVERKCGYFSLLGKTVEVVDLPGTYSLTQASEASALDEQIVCEFVAKKQADIMINIADASNLERHLYLTLQLRERGVPVILVLNMMDVAIARHIHIDTERLSTALGCPVIAIEAKSGRGVTSLKQLIASPKKLTASAPLAIYPFALEESIQSISPDRSESILLLENDVYAKAHASTSAIENAAREQLVIQTALQEEADILLADARYRFIDATLKNSLVKTAITKTSWTSRIDRVVLNRVLGIPIFLGVMYALFFFSINVGGAFQDFFDISSQTIFVDGFAAFLQSIGTPMWLTVLLANGIGKGINTTLTFIPVIGAMFLFLAFLEDSGYMARAAFVIDRLMRFLGLPGKAFVPMIVGFGCNVPAVMGARTLDNQRDRILTIMMAPFMSCGARLAIFAVFTAAFFPSGGEKVVFALYLIGILMAVFTGFILRQTVLKGEPSTFVMELPPYHLPNMKTLLMHAWQRLRGFVLRAGRLIVPICVIIGALNSLNLDGTMNTGTGDTQSLLSMVGRYVTPLFSPMGMQPDNWPATVGLVTGILAKEVVVGTLNTLYTQMGHFALLNTGTSFSVGAGLSAALHSIPQNFSALTQAFYNPVLAVAPMEGVNQGVYGLMYRQFDGQIGAFAYLLFVLLYFPCVSTTAVMLRELHRGWSIFSIVWMTSVAYSVAVIFYQAATFARHPVASCAWIFSLLLMFAITFWVIRSMTAQARLSVDVPAGEMA